MTRLLSTMLCVWIGLWVLYASHLALSPFVYEDARLVPNVMTTPPVTALRLLRGRGLSEASWHVINMPPGAHAFNLLLHGTVVMLFALLLWQVTRSTWIANSGALLLTFHPLTTESVAYAASRSELMAGALVLAALVCATSWAGLWALIPALLGAAYLSKETGLVGLGLLPVAIWLSGERRWAWRIGSLILGGASLYAVLYPDTLRTMHLVGQYSGNQMNGWTWAALQAMAVWRLVFLSLAPIALTVDPPIPITGPHPWWAVAILCVGLAEIAWRVKDRAPLVTAGLAGMLIVALPRFFVPTPTAPFNEHQWYLAMPWVSCVLIGLLLLAHERWSAA